MTPRRAATTIAAYATLTALVALAAWIYWLAAQ